MKDRKILVPITDKISADYEAYPIISHQENSLFLKELSEEEYLKEKLAKMMPSKSIIKKTAIKEAKKLNNFGWYRDATWFIKGANWLKSLLTQEEK